ncbi:MAG TPA: sugar phosphate isomerase/epimerase [Gemmatimonadaceae bacterium]|nr:sugar phosphate isomerase/epimerase [Gemmatimonadaceae bacterium]
MSDQNVPRRSFLKLAALGAASAVFSKESYGLEAPLTLARAGGSNSKAKEVGVKLGVASYSLRNFPRAKAIEMTKALGTPYINLKSVHLPYESSPAEIAAARRELEAAGLQIVGGGTITFEKDTDDDVQRYFDYAKAAGMPVMVSTCNPAFLPRVEKFAKRYDIKVALHNHGPEDTNFPSPYDVLKAVKGMDARMGLCMDIGHTVRTGTDPVRAAADAGPRLLDMHAKDLRDLKVKESQCIVGEGQMPIAALFRQLQKMRYLGYVNLEYEIDADDPLPGMKQSMAHMRGVLVGLAVRS